MLLNFFEKAAFDFKILDDCFNDQVAVFQLRQVVFEVSDGDEGSAIGSKERRGFGFLRGFVTARAMAF